MRCAAGTRGRTTRCEHRCPDRLPNRPAPWQPSGEVDPPRRCRPRPLRPRASPAVAAGLWMLHVAIESSRFAVVTGPQSSTSLKGKDVKRTWSERRPLQRAHQRLVARRKWTWRRRHVLFIGPMQAEASSAQVARRIRIVPRAYRVAVRIDPSERWITTSPPPVLCANWRARSTPPGRLVDLAISMPRRRPELSPPAPASP